jgi:hypothetical protein
MKSSHEEGEGHSRLLWESGADDFRERTLQRALAQVRRVRKRRRVLRAGIMLTTPLCLVFGTWWSLRSTDSAPPVHRAIFSEPKERMETVPGTAIRVLSDEELFALLGNRPIAVIGQSSEQRLVLLDELDPP